MGILFTTRGGINKFSLIICREIEKRSGFNYIMGMIAIAYETKAITAEERASLIAYLQQSYEEGF